MRRELGLVFVALAIAATAQAQSALDGFDPNPNGIIRCALLQPDGKLLIGGDFTTLAPNGGAAVTRNRIARLNPDGTLDAAFNPNANSTVYALALQSDGKIIVGGAFVGASSIGAQTRSRIARLDPTSGFADSWNPIANGEVHALAVQTDGKIIAGGLFFGANSIGGQSRNGLARLDPSTGLADAWDPQANTNSISALAIQPDGKIIVGGDFAAIVIGGQTRNFIVRLDPFTALADSWNPNANGEVATIAFQPDGKILVGGNFNVIGGAGRAMIARLDPASGTADSFDPNANGFVRSIALQSDGKILVGGDFNGANSIGLQSRNRIARLDPNTGLADSFNPSANNTVRCILQQSDGKVIAAGDFNGSNSIGTITRNRIVRLESDARPELTIAYALTSMSHIYAIAVQPDGKILLGGKFFFTSAPTTPFYLMRVNADGSGDANFTPNPNDEVDAIAIQPDGKIIVGGLFSGANSIGGQTRNRIARLDPVTGAADSWNPNANGHVEAIAVQPDGKILVGGAFSGTNSIGGQTRNRIARLDPNTGAADAFDPNANADVWGFALQADGKVFVDGLFNSVGGQTRLWLARLDPNTGLADSFDAQSNNVVYSMALQPDGKLLVGGIFSQIGGQMISSLGRLDPTTAAADLSFTPNPNEQVNSIALQGDGKIIVGGFFNGAIGGQTRAYIARLSAANGVADSYNPNASAGIRAVALQADGKVLVAGDFATIGGQSRTALARLTNDTAAGQNLAVTPTSISWTRAGGSPQFERVTFESSTDNVSYNSLGTATPSGNAWVLSNLSLPRQQNIFIRARGYCRHGVTDASQSLIELVREVYLGPALQLSSVVSRKTHGTAGDFSINLPLSGTPGIECRSAAANGTHTLVLTFNNGLTSGSAVVSSGVGSVNGTPDIVGNTMTVNLTGVADQQTLTVTTQNVTDTFGQTLPNTAVSIGFLVGDTNADRFVNSGDATVTRNLSGQTANASNFRSDVNLDGVINSADATIVRNHSGSTIGPAAPRLRLRSDVIQDVAPGSPE